MSGTLNILIASLGGPSPVGLLAAISNPNNGDLETGSIALKNDQLNLVFRTSDGSPSITKFITARMGLDLSFTWQRSLNNDVNFITPYQVAIDSAGNVVVVGSLFDSSTSTHTPYIVKFNSSGTLQWQSRMPARAVHTAVAIDSSDNIYAVGYSEVNAVNRYDIYVIKYSASGVIQYQRIVGDTGTLANELAYSVAIPNASSFAMAGEIQLGNTDAFLWFLQQSDGTTGSAVSVRDAGGSGTQQALSVIKGETDDVLYYAVRSYATLSTASKCTQVLIKWTASGGFVWQRFFADSGTVSIFVHSMVMSSDNSAVYVVASTGDTQIQITKWGTDGSLLWQRGIDSPTALPDSPTIAVDSLDNIYVGFRSFDASLTDDRFMVLKVPGSGAGSGNSATLEGVTYNYITTSRIAFANTLLSSSLSKPNVSYSLSPVTPTPTNVAGTLTVTTGPF